METTVFYSWQSDDRTTRRYIEKSLTAAIADLSENPDIEASPRMDKDTQGAAGAVHIVDTIQTKIKDCGIFLADVSLIDTSNSGRRIVNLNVMFELGYAMGVHSESRIILVANGELGDLKDLPFDISHHRIITFSPVEDPRGAKLAASLKSAIRIHLDELDRERRNSLALSAKDSLLKAIEDGKPVRTVSKKYFEEVYQKYLNLAPARYTGSDINDYKRSVYNAYANSRVITLDLFDVLNTAAEYGKDDVLVSGFKHLEMVSQYYDSFPGDPNPAYTVSSEYYGLIVYEIVAIILGLISREKMWNAMVNVYHTKHNRPEHYGGSGRSFNELYIWPEHTLEYYKELKGVNYYVPSSPLIEERLKEEGDLLQAYIDGSLLRLFMVDDYCWVIPMLMTHNWERHTPQFLEEFKKKDFSKALREITGESSTEEFNHNIWVQASKSVGYMPYHNNLLHIFQHFKITGEGDMYHDTSQKVMV